MNDINVICATINKSRESRDEVLPSASTKRNASIVHKMLVALCAVVFGLGFITAIAISSTAKFKIPLGPIATRAPLSKASDFSPDFVKDDASRTKRVVHIDDRDLMTR